MMLATSTSEVEEPSLSGSQTYIVLLKVEPAGSEYRRSRWAGETDRLKKRAKIREISGDALLGVESFALEHGLEPTAMLAAAAVGFIAEVTVEEVARLRADPRVEAVFLDTELQATAEASLQPGPCTTTAFKVDHAISVSGGPVDSSTKDTFIWVVDSGIDTNHPDLNVVGAPYAAAFGNNTTTNDGFGHGTMVAGVAAAKYNSFGPTGMSAGAKVVPLNVYTPPYSPRASG